MMYKKSILLKFILILLLSAFLMTGCADSIEDDPGITLANAGNSNGGGSGDSGDSGDSGVSAKEVTAFRFASPSAIGTISGTAISVDVPCGTNVTTLVATFTTTGSSVTVGSTTQVSGTTSNEFSTPVTYTVTADDSTTQDYIVTISSDCHWVQDAYAKASNADSSDKLGSSVAISGDLLVVGATGERYSGSSVTGDGLPTTTTNDNFSVGAVYVFQKINGDWIQKAFLKPSNPTTNVEFGTQVAVEGEIIVVSAPSEADKNSPLTNTDGQPTANAGGGQSGAVYVFKKSGGVWVQDAYLKSSNIGTGDNFGTSIDISGSTIVVGASGEDSNHNSIVNTNNTTGGTDDGNADDSGAVYVFKKDGNGDWYQDAYLKPTNNYQNYKFGTSVAIDGDIMVVGGTDDASNSTSIENTDSVAPAHGTASTSGAAWVFKKVGDDWIQDAYLKASNAQTSDYFGWSVALSGSTIIVGAPFEDSDATTITNDNNDHSGSDPANDKQYGAAYVFKKDSSGDWYQDAYLKPSQYSNSYMFGFKVSISGSLIVINTLGDISNTQAIINTDGEASSDTSAASSVGAAYLFKNNSSGNWIQDAYLKGTNVEASDSFASSIAIDGGIVAVGATEEDGNDKSVTNTDDSHTESGSTSSSGAVYIFKGSN